MQGDSSNVWDNNWSSGRFRSNLLGPQANVAQVGDMVCVLYGAEAPCILRGEGSRASYIGDAYVHGYMDGEATREAAIPPIDFRLR